MAQVNNTNNQIPEPPARSIREVQQEFAESLGYGMETIWDLFSNYQLDAMKTKIEALIPDPRVPDNLNGDELKAAEKKVAKQRGVCERIRETLFTSVWGQRKYTNRQSLTSIFYVLVASQETDTELAKYSRIWSCHPVFRTRRCVSDNDGRGNNSSDCCMIYVDEHGRVYQNWSSFLSENELPKGIMVTPCKGVYQLDRQGRVLLESCVTPAGSTNRKVLGVLDTTTAVAGLTAASVPLIGLVCAVAAPVMLVAGGVGLAAAGYTTARSGAQLVDRSMHEQSINVTDRQARNHWISGIAGLVGLGAAGATSAMTAATSAGREVGAITQITVNSMNISSIMVSGTGLANGAMDLFLKYQDGDDISTLDALQLSTSLFLFTHSVYNFKLASTIISDTQNSRIGSYRETLSNRQRRMFDKTFKETMRTGGRKSDIIRNVNDIPSRQQFNDLYKINKDLNQRGVRPSFGRDGKIVLNNQVATNTAELRASVQHNAGPDILGSVTNPIPESVSSAGVRGGAGRTFTVPMSLSSSSGVDAGVSSLETIDGAGNNWNALRLCTLVINGVGIALQNYGTNIFERIVDGDSFKDTLLSLADNLPEETMKFVLTMLELFMDCMWEELRTVLKFFISSESVLYRLGCTILDDYRYRTLDYIQEQVVEILQSVNDYFMSLNPNNFPDLLTRCKTCSGFFSICEL